MNNDELSPDARDFLQAEREALEPTQEERSRMGVKVSAAIAAGAATAGAASASAAVTGVTAGSGAAASGGLALGLKGLILVALSGVVATGAVILTPAENEEAAPSTSEGREVEPPAPPALPIEIAEVEALEVVPDFESPRRRHRERQQTTGERIPEQVSPEPGAGIADELLLLRSAQRARARGDIAGALAILREHRSRFPTGSFAAERDGTRVLLLCEDNRPGAAAAAARFLAARPGSPLRARVLEACP